MKSKPLWFKIVLIALVFVAICLAVVAALAFYWSRSWTQYSSYGLHSSKDQQLIAIFHAHRAEFEWVQQMAAEDRKHGWYLGLSDTNQINKSRWRQYEALTSGIYSNLDATMDGYGEGMRFIFAGGGTSAIGPGWVKGIEYVPRGYKINGDVYGDTQPQWQGLILTNLDNAQTLPANVYLRPIEPNWFVFYQRSD